MNKEWQEQLENKRQNLIKEFHQMNDNPLDEIYLGNKLSDLRKDRDSWYKQAQELNQSLLRQDKVIDDFRKQIKFLKGQMVDIQHDNDRLEHNYIEQLNRAKLVDKWIKAYNDHKDTKEESEFIHVFRRILIEHHMDSRG